MHYALVASKKSRVGCRSWSLVGISNLAHFDRPILSTQTAPKRQLPGVKRRKVELSEEIGRACASGAGRFAP
jgi:hypothetical protein